MFKGNHIFRIGATILAIFLITIHSVGFYEAFTSFFMGLGSGLSLVGIGKRFVEMRTE